MNDAATILRAYLISDPALWALTGTRVWMHYTTPPKDAYKPSHGGALTIVDSDSATEAAGVLLRNRWQCSSFGPDRATIVAVEKALWTAMVSPEAKRYGITVEGKTGGGPILEEPVTGWLVKLSFFVTRIKSGFPIPV
jgi:hypothetical protein